VFEDYDPELPTNEEWENEKRIAVRTPRLISILSFLQLFELYSPRSTIQQQIDS